MAPAGPSAVRSRAARYTPRSSGLRGTELVEDVRLFGADPVTGERGKATDRLDVEPNALVFSYEHQVLVEASA